MNSNYTHSNSINLNCNIPVMSDHEFKLMSDLIYSRWGINLSYKKKMMLTSRLRKRLKELEFSTFTQYYNYISNSHERDTELCRMIDEVSTNKTEFFRENKHFDFLHNSALPELIKNENFIKTRMLNFWSAGCSSGEEPYTLALLLEEYFSKYPTGDYSILATDISTKMLDKAKMAIYNAAQIQPIPEFMKHKYLMKAKDSSKETFRITPELRNKIKFLRLNLMKKDFNINNQFDVIFCRNVIIYFDRHKQIELFEKFEEQLVPGGYLILGSSETLQGIKDKFENVAPTIYRKPIYRNYFTKQEQF